MATSIAEILKDTYEGKDNIKALFENVMGEIDNTVTLDQLNSQSMASIYAQVAFVTSVVMHIREDYFDLHKKQYEDFIFNNYYGNPRWLVQKIKGFQYGDPLIVNPSTGQTYYETIDETKQIANFVSSSKSNAGLTSIKVAKDDQSGNPIAFTQAELLEFKAFLNLIQIPGTNLEGVSNDPDLARIYGTVYYNGAFTQTIGNNVDQAIKAYFRSPEFNGRVLFNTLIDKVQEVPGVTDFVINDFQAATATGSFSSHNRFYNPLSGFMKVDPNNQLSSTLTFVVE